MTEAYEELTHIFRRYYALNGASAMLGWDNATMPATNPSFSGARHARKITGKTSCPIRLMC